MPARPRRDPRRPRRLRWSAALLAGGLLAGCTSESPLLEIPSRVEGSPPARFAEAVDSGRVAARRHVKARYLPGASVAVGRDGAIVWAEGFGWADLSHQDPATPETLYPVGSISKSFTATAAGLLYERGRLDFDVPVQEYVPEFPEKRWPITTRQVMGHVSGIIRSRGIGEALRQGTCDDARSALAVFADDTLLFEPGEEYRYSNFGYRLVGAVVEAAAGERFLDFMDREVFTPMGMDRTVPDLGDEGPFEATKYDRGPFRTLRRGQEIDMSCSMAPGGFLSTPTELVRFGFAMLHGEILDPATVELLWTPQRLNSGEPTRYGFGWQITSVRLGDDAGASTRMIGHGGSVLGGRASLMIFPDERMVVAAMTNASDDVSDLASEIAAFFRDPG